jgi:hypothetical protein
MYELVCFPFWFGLSLEVAPANFFSWLRHCQQAQQQILIFLSRLEKESGGGSQVGNDYCYHAPAPGLHR